MRFGFLDTASKSSAPVSDELVDAVSDAGPSTGIAWPKPSDMIPEMMPLYDAEQFEGLIQRERARADRAAARPKRDLSQRRTTPMKGPGGSMVDPVWGATTDNREFSLVVFRPRTRGDRSGLVELLQNSVRTTDAVGVIDNRRLGVLLPDTSAPNAVLFVKKVLAGAQAASVQVSHVVHTYPESWPDDGSSNWDEPRRNEKSDGASTPTPTEPPQTQQRSTAARPIDDLRDGESRLVRGFVNWLQSTALRRPRTSVRA